MSKTTPTATPAAAPIDMDALPTGGGSYTRQPDGTLVPTGQAPEATAAYTETATQPATQE